MNMNIDYSKHGQRVEVNVCGEIDAYTAPKLRESLFQLLEKEDIEMVINLENVVYMDSTGLGVFVGVFKKIRSNQGELKIIGLTDRLKRLFEITGLADIMDINGKIEGETQ